MSSSVNDPAAPPAASQAHETAPETAVEQDQPETVAGKETEERESTSSSPEHQEAGGSKDEDTGGSPKEQKDKEGEEAAVEDENPPLPDEPVPSQAEWQAVWSPAHNAYYFYNTRTAETTWVNPLDPSASSSSSTLAATASSSATQPHTAPAPTPTPAATDDVPKPPQDLSYLNGIDPELAYLDPTLAVPSAGAKGPVPTFTARFGARSGKFTAMDGRQPEHLSEAARAQRMSSVYFDTAAWEREIAERDAKAKADQEAGVGEKRKRVTKADIERFKAQKQAKKAIRNAWLRE